MILGVQTHFSQGWSTSLLDEAAELGTLTIRDSVRWGDTEKKRGAYDFSDPRAAWIDTALAKGAQVTLVFPGNGNKLYDGGYSVYTDAGREGFADFIVATLKRFPNVDAIEVGNEYIGNNFVTGPIASQPLGQRDEAYAAMLAAVDRKLDEAGITAKIIGGAAHSIPVDWFSDLKANGAFAHMDAVAIHPYTTQPEQFEDQITVLRTAMGDRQLPIEVTEFGQEFKSLEDAPAYLAKMVAVMAAADIDRASWYALAKQKGFPNMELYDPATSQETPAGKTFAFLEQLLQRGDVDKVAVDDFTYFYTFGDGAAVVWGEPRDLTLGDGVAAYDLSGQPIANFDGHIDKDEPVVLISTQPLTLGGNVQFEASALVATSFDQFDVLNPIPESTAGFEGPWSYFALSGAGKMSALQTMGGGLRNGESWTPYLGLTWLRPLFVSSTSLTPVDFGDGKNPASAYKVVERFTSDAAQTVTIQGQWDVADSSADGITLTVRKNQTVLLDTVVFDPASGHVFDFNLAGVALENGDTIDFIVGPNGGTRGSDRTTRSITITADQTGDQAYGIGSAAGTAQDHLGAHDTPFYFDAGSFTLI